MITTRSILHVADHDARLGEAAGPQMVSTVDLSDLSSFQVSCVADHRPSSNQYLVVPEPFRVAAHVIEGLSGGTASVRLYRKRIAQEECLSTLRKRRRTLSQTQG